MITLIEMTASIADVFERITSVAAGCADAAVAMKKRRQTYNALSALDDRALHDIGLNRTILLGASVHDVCASRPCCLSLKSTEGETS